MNPFQSPLSIAFNLALLPLAVIVLASFAIRERLTPLSDHSAKRRA